MFPVTDSEGRVFVWREYFDSLRGCHRWGYVCIAEKPQPVASEDTKGLVRNNIVEHQEKQ